MTQKKNSKLDSKVIGGIAAMLFASVVAGSAQAHFILRKPDSYVDQEEGAFGGAPQKGGPCGPGGIDDVSPVPTNGKVTDLHVGDPLDFEWEITVPHDGYFRIALAEDRGDFVDPEFTDATACTYDDSSVQHGAHDNVLMDGIDPEALGQKLVVPDMPCEKCTLQVIQVMRNHGPPNCIYYHCADVRILASGNSPDGGVTGSGGAASTGSGGTGSGGVSAGGAGGVSGAAGAPAGSGGSSAGSGGNGATAATGGTGAVGTGGTSALGSGGAAVPVDTATDSDDGGCAVAEPGASASSSALLSMFGIGLIAAGMRRRRR